MNQRGMMLLAGGVVAIVIGVYLLLVGYEGITQPLACPITGCPSLFSSQYTSDWLEIAIGAVLIVAGTAMIIASKRAKNNPLAQERQMHIAEVPARVADIQVDALAQYSTTE